MPGFDGRLNYEQRIDRSVSDTFSNGASMLVDACPPFYGLRDLVFTAAKTETTTTHRAKSDSRARQTPVAMDSARPICPD